MFRSLSIASKHLRVVASKYYYKIESMLSHEIMIEKRALCNIKDKLYIHTSNYTMIQLIIAITIIITITSTTNRCPKAIAEQ